MARFWRSVQFWLVLLFAATTLCAVLTWAEQMMPKQ